MPKNKKIISPSSLFYYSYFYFHLEESVYNLLLYLFSEKYLDKYLIIKESFAIRKNIIPEFRKYNYIYKNEKYIIKNILSKPKIEIHFRFVYLYVICGILYLNGSNIYYGSIEKIIMIKYICDKIGIEYKICKDHIKIFIADEKDIKQEKNRYYKGDIYFTRNNKSLITKIGKYVLFIS